MHQPSPGRQGITQVIADLEAQRQRLTDAITWTKNFAQAMAKVPQVEFTNVGPVLPGCREVEIAFSLPTGSRFQDIPAFTLVCTPSDQELASLRQETALAGEALRLTNLLNWQAKGVRVFEVWFVQTHTLCLESPEATQMLLTKLVREWLAYWFEQPPKAIYREPRPGVWKT